MKHIKGYKIFESNIDDYYKEITFGYIRDNIPRDRFIDIDNRVVKFVKNNISKNITDHAPRVKIFTDSDKNSGIYNENCITNLTIYGFDYSIKLTSYTGSVGKWLRTFRIFALIDDYYIACFTMTGYSMYFLCDQFDGLAKLLVDYKICDDPVNESNIFKEEDYYTELSFNEYRKYLDNIDLLSLFNETESDILEDLFNKKGYKYSIDVDRDWITIGSSLPYTTICKCEDEWYYLNIQSSSSPNISNYYKCDGFEGLLRCINDLMPDIIKEGNIFKEEDYYTEMLYDDAREMIKSKKRIEFSDKEMNILEDIADKRGYKYSTLSDSPFGNCVNFYKQSSSQKIVLGDLTKCITKFDDEWYIFMRYNKKMDGLSEVYYKCDGFEGLLKCINDMMPDIIKENLLSDCDYYSKITSNEYCIYYMHAIDMEQKYYKSIKELTKSIFLNVNPSINIINASFINKHIRIDFTKYLYGIERIDIFLLKDEYFVVEVFNINSDILYNNVNSKFYKCDQIDGLFSLLKDLCVRETSSNRIDESLSDCDYYSKISPSKFLELEFSEIDIQRYYKTISDCISNNFSEEYPGIRLRYRKSIAVDFKRFIFGIKRINIFLVDDEYFIVDVFETGEKSVFYKCDQIDGLIQLLNDLKTFRTNTYSLDESLDTQDESLVRRVYNLEYERWVQNRKPENFNKKDTVAVFEIIKNLDPEYFGQTIDKYPFGKRREKSYWIRNQITEFRDYFVDRKLDEIKIMSDFFFTNHNFDGIHINYYNNHIHFDKYQDEWYDIIITSNQNDQIRYICDSIDGLKEAVNMVNDLKFEYDDNINESINVEDSLVKKIDNYEFNEFFRNHKLDKHTEDDVEIYMNFLREIFDEDEISIDSHFLETGKTWTAMIEENGYDTTGCFNIDKFEDEWYLVERQIDDNWSPVTDYWLIDTKDGFKQLKNEIFE